MRKKQKSIFYDNGTPTPHHRAPMNQSYTHSYQNSSRQLPPTPVPDSLERFQQEIQRTLLLQRKESMIPPQSKGRRRVKTQALYQSDQDQVPNKQLSRLQSEIGSLKQEVKSYHQSNRFEDRLDTLVKEMNRNRELDREMFMHRQSQPLPPNIFFPPTASHYPPSRFDDDYKKKPESHYQQAFRKPKNRARRLLRKYFFAVAFPVLLKCQAKKLALKRRANLRKFYLQKFNPQMLHLKNWLVEGLSFSLPIILEKQKLSLKFWDEKRENIAKEKQVLLLKIVQIGLSKLKQECTPQKVTNFAEILHNLCSGGSFAMSRFWSAYEMKNICISEYLGCVRADETLQKFMIGLVVVVKVLIFNMLLQPQKFDSINFPKHKQPLTSNMHIIASVYYRLVKTILTEYLDQPRAKFYKIGNWLTIKEEFIVECCEPLIYNVEYPEQDEWITGMVESELSLLTDSNQWSKLVDSMRFIIQFFHREMKKRRKDVIRNQKYKLYN